MKKSLIIGCAIFAAYIIIALLAPALAPHDPVADRFEPYIRPSFTHLLGTNDIGRDIFSELIMGTGQSLLVGFLAAALALVIGVVFGVAAGWFGGALDSVLSGVGSFFITIPFFPLVIVLSAYLGMGGGGSLTPAVILGLLGWPETARLLRAQTIALRERQYIFDIRAMGAKSGYVFTRHVPRELAPMMAYRFILSFRAGVLAEATLSFLGLGSPVALSWGNMLYFAQARHAFLTGTWVWWVLPPGLMLAGLVAALLLVSYYFEEAADPRLGAR